tara:strand:- start:78 stop:692 length:615 start_codon:yes stop_codon:yes gene_type:complete
MFEINNKKVETYKVENYTFNVINDFYKNPDEIVDLFKLVEPSWHKHFCGFYHQGVDFKDMRHYIYTDEITPVYDFLEEITNEQALDFDDGYYKKLVNTNYIKFLNHKFDDYFFYPHRDHGKTAIVYFNKEKSKGTNFYHPIKYQEGEEHKEHFIAANQVEVLHHINSEYNKLIIWEGKDLWHGLCMDPKYTDEWRINQPFFFQA